MTTYPGSHPQVPSSPLQKPCPWQLLGQDIDSQPAPSYPLSQEQNLTPSPPAAQVPCPLHPLTQDLALQRVLKRVLKLPC